MTQYYNNSNSLTKNVSATNLSKLIRPLTVIAMGAFVLSGCNNQTISPNPTQKNTYPMSNQRNNNRNISNQRYENQSYDTTNYTLPQRDPITGLIVSRQRQYRNVPATYPYYPNTAKNQKNSRTINTTNPDFKNWLSTHDYLKPQVLAYQNYLQSQLGQVPPIDQLVASARDARACGYEPYEVPPVELWQNIVPTLQLLQKLQKQGYLPYSTVIRSVYRNPELNRCAGGAGESKHITNGAMDIWIPENDGNRWAIDSTYDGICQFWQSSGQDYNFGLGLYPTGSIHLDTQGYRKWGANHSSSSSPCRF